MTVAPPSDFYLRDVLSLARDLIGVRLEGRGASGVIVETEAYRADDPASHSFNGLTPRNRSMFGPAGRAYVYRAYGVHLCLNVVGRPGEAVLIRALAPVEGLDLMAKRRSGRLPLCAGPGRLCESLGVSLDDDGTDFATGPLRLCLTEKTTGAVLCGPRIGISRAKELPWRFGLAGAPLSRKIPG
ncbi:DNA-3-methyladenine glycosylase [Falsigemmobacter faecalis]|uniref:Putative 3-methyladenine DNA glycosylase n=1 Tax=Falsigemmobacter faecalis TaxID=2488730 RepID=A0A3P3DES3_9RHOB|nr:DNA-3-methyladenine glycosylase [Falsigemmobacter faecalis]RRH72763.1 DNA-3-methyladenine glycosylase [Falsigemmobacter faecalis]